MHHAKTFLLLAALTALFVVVGGMLGGTAGLVIAVGLAAVMNLGAYWYSDRIVLRIYKAREIGPGEGHGLYEVVKSLAHKAGLPMPAVYIIDSDSPNAFATGRNPANASVAATAGLVQHLSREELTGVMAHEMSHVAHRDTLTMAITATLAGAISSIANMFMWFSLFGMGGDDDEGGTNPLVAMLMMILAPIAATMVQFAISRSREYAADERGAELCGHPEWLASALEKLESLSQGTVMREAETHPGTAHLFITNPLRAQQMAQLFSTHPSTEDRVARLRAMARA